MPEAGNRRFRITTFACLVIGPAVLSAAERLDLRESPENARIFQVLTDVRVAGKVYPQPGADKALKLDVSAKLKLLERRLPGDGRESRSLRAVRFYETAEATISIGQQISQATLRDSVRLIVARGEPEGLDLFSPSGPLSYPELELLRNPGDSLALLGLLPDSKVEVGETWKPSDWVLPQLTGIEAAEKSVLVCQLADVKSGIARVTFQGEITGVIQGAPAAIKVDGQVLFGLEHKHFQRAEFTQTEKRAIGTISPGLDVTAKISLSRSIAKGSPRLTDQDLKKVPTEPNEASRLLLFEAPHWNVRFYHDRKWHQFHQTADVAVLRLLDQGGLVAQCNIKNLPDAEPGQHVPEAQFQADIQRTLGKEFGEIIQAEKLELNNGQFIFRVFVTGRIERPNAKKEIVSIPMQWLYYLVANPDGRQVALVFTLEAQQSAALQERDVAIVGAMEFLKRRANPVKPTAGRRK